MRTITAAALAAFLLLFCHRESQAPTVRTTSKKVSALALVSDRGPAYYVPLDENPAPNWRALGYSPGDVVWYEPGDDDNGPTFIVEPAGAAHVISRSLRYSSTLGSPGEAPPPQPVAPQPPPVQPPTGNPPAAGGDDWTLSFSFEREDATEADEVTCEAVTPQGTQMLGKVVVPAGDQTFTIAGHFHLAQIAPPGVSVRATGTSLWRHVGDFQIIAVR